jgi:hypothetical protein
VGGIKKFLIIYILKFKIPFFQIPDLCRGQFGIRKKGAGELFKPEAKLMIFKSVFHQ